MDVDDSSSSRGGNRFGCLVDIISDWRGGVRAAIIVGDEESLLKLDMRLRTDDDDGDDDDGGAAAE